MAQGKVLRRNGIADTRRVSSGPVEFGTSLAYSPFIIQQTCVVIEKGNVLSVSIAVIRFVRISRALFGQCQRSLIPLVCQRSVMLKLCAERQPMPERRLRLIEAAGVIESLARTADITLDQILLSDGYPCLSSSASRG